MSRARLAAALRSFVDATGLPDQTVARDAGLSKTTLSRMLARAEQLTIPNVDAVLEATGRSWGALIRAARKR